jgi:long-subunit fatty acid transport protein
MGRFFLFFVSIFFTHTGFTAFQNFNNILIGDQAAGLGGAYTAMVGDSSASSFYNPGALIKIKGDNISASATLFNKYDTTYGESRDILAAGERVNRGFFRTVPSSLGGVYHWGKVAGAFSIVVPDYDFFSGNIANKNNTQSFLNYSDESLWSGFSMSFLIDHHNSFGASIYYTARSLIRTATDRNVVSDSHEIFSYEEKSIKHNGLVLVLGHLWKVNEALNLGFSYRPPALRLSGQGTYYRSITDTNTLPSDVTFYKNIKADTYIPSRIALGAAYKLSDRFLMSFDSTYYPGHGYSDLDRDDAADKIEHKDTWNGAIGAEYKFLRPKAALRVGLFTNNPSNKRPSENPTVRTGDYLELYGLSANMAFNVNDYLQYTVGGFYTGGKGQSVQRNGANLVRMDKTHHVFSLLISTSYVF